MSFIDLMGNTVWTEDQISRYCERLVSNQFPKRRVRELDDIVTGAAQNRYTPTAEEAAEIQAYGDLRFAVRDERIAALADNQKLIAVLAYEQAVRRLDELVLLIEGRIGQAEVLDEFGEVVTPAVEAVEPLPLTVEVNGEVVDNPALEAAWVEREELQGVVDGASAAVLALWLRRIC